jgi:peptide chain release factor subunit 1
VAVITEAAIRELAAFRGQDAPVTSIYLDVDGRRFVRHQDYEHELDLLLKTAREKAAGVGSVNDDLRKIDEYVRAGFDRSTTRGLAFFACSTHGLFEVVALPVPVRNSVILNSAPAVGQLELFAQDHNRFGVLLVDKQRARMLVFEFGELSDHSELYEELPRDYDTRGQHDQGYDRERHHVDELAAQHVRHAAQVAFHVLQERGFEHFTIGASDAVAHELESHLHQYLRDRLVGRINVTTASTLDEIRRAALELEAEVDRREEAEVVSKLRDAVGSGQKGVSELEPVLRALGEHRVERLIVSEGFVESGWRCPSCHVLATVGRACPVCSTDMDAIDDVVEEAVEDALAGGVKVDICVGNADLDVLGRIGALLRY